MILKGLAASAVALSLANVSPALAQTERSAVVNVAGLDLASAPGRAELDVHVASAAKQVCGHYTPDGERVPRFDLCLAAVRAEVFEKLPSPQRQSYELAARSSGTAAR